ncbi:MAG: hypothetical protein ACYC97_09765 [Metallibacterium sp.]
MTMGGLKMQVNIIKCCWVCKNVKISNDEILCKLSKELLKNIGYTCEKFNINKYLLETDEAQTS